MKINKIRGHGHHYMNDLNVVISDTWSQGIGDSLGRTSRAVLIYDEDREELIKGIKSYFSPLVQTSPETGKHIYVTRYPGDDPWAYARGNSRDHVLKTLASMIILGEDEWVKNFLKNKAKRPCIDHKYSITQKILMKSFYSKFWSWIYISIEIPYLLLMLVWNFICRALTWSWKSYKTVPEYYEAQQLGKIKPLKKWQRWLADIAMFPTFAVFYGAFTTNAMKSKVAFKVVRFFYKLHFEKHNYVGRALCGKPIPQEIKDTWIPSRKNRWSISLNRTCNRPMKPHENDTPENNLELGMLYLDI